MTKLDKLKYVYRTHGPRMALGKIVQAMSEAILKEERTTFHDYWDRYLENLVAAVPGMMVRGNAWCYEYAFQRLPSDAPVLEIGSYAGLQTCVMAYMLRRHCRENRIINVDAWDFEDKSLGDCDITSTAFSHFVHFSFFRNRAFFSKRGEIITYEMDSDDFFMDWSGPLSFAFIDGNHTYEYALRDFQNVDRWLEPGGFILFDDSQDGPGPFQGVNQVMSDVRNTGRYELVAKNPNYLWRKLR